MSLIKLFKLILVGLLVIFLIQNIATTPHVYFLTWHFSAKLIIVIPIVFFAGVLIGKLNPPIPPKKKIFSKDKDKIS